MTTLTVEIEHVLREQGDLSTENLAGFSGCPPELILQALDRHPLIVGNGSRNGGSCWRLIDARGSGPLTDGDRVKTSEAEPDDQEAWVAIVCPDCGCSHEITRGHLRKIKRGARSARCGSCSEMRVYRAGAMPARMLV